MVCKLNMEIFYIKMKLNNFLISLLIIHKFKNNNKILKIKIKKYKIFKKIKKNWKTKCLKLIQVILIKNRFINNYNNFIYNKKKRLI
jgi:hypothetical protein